MSGRTVLIIEDNVTNMKLARDIVQSRGAKTLEAETAETGIEQAKKHLPDLILMDFQLPGLNGLDATKQLKSCPSTSHIPVIALTAQAMAGDREKAMASGCDEYIAKPYRYKKFVDTIETFLQPAIV